MPQFIITSPQGQKFKVTAPDGASQADILAYAQKNMPGQGPDFSEANPADPATENPAVTQRAAQVANPMNGQGSAADSAINGLTLGFGDEAAGAIGGALDWAGFGPEGSKGTFSGGYDRVTGNIRNKVQDYRARHPVAATVAEIAGSLPTLALPGGAAMKAERFGAKVLASSATGGATGLIQGFGEGEGGLQNRISSAESGALTGAAFGAGVPFLGRAAAKAVGSRAGMKAVPSNDEIEAASNALRKQANEANLTVAPKPFAQAVQKIALGAAEDGIDPTIHPKATAALGRLVDAAKSGEPIPLSEIDKLRKVMRGASAAMDPSEKFHAAQMINKLDDFMENLRPNEVNAADRLQAVATMKESRRLWTMHKKADILEDVADRAKLSSDATKQSLDSALRREFKNLLRDKNRSKSFTPAEKGEIARMVAGHGLQNITNKIGKAAPTGIVSAGIGGGAGLAAFGPLGALAVPAVGWAAKKASEKLATRNMARLEATIRNAGERPFDQAAAGRAQTLSDLYLGAAGRAAVPLTIDGKKEPLKVYIGQPTPGYR